MAYYPNPNEANKKNDAYPYDNYEDVYEDDSYVSENEIYDEDALYDVYPEQDDYYDADLITPEEKKMRVIGRYRFAAGMIDFVLVIVGIVVILLFLVLAVSLLQWLQSDMMSSYNQLVSGV